MNWYTVALLGAVVVFWAVQHFDRELQWDPEDGPSPALGLRVIGAVKRLVGRGGDGDGDGDAEGDVDHEVEEWGSFGRVRCIPDCPACELRRKRGASKDAPIPEPKADHGIRPIDIWVYDCLEDGVKYAAIVRAGTSEWSCSKRTVERSIAKVNRMRDQDEWPEDLSGSD